MKIIHLHAENIKKLVAVDITPAGNVVKITGKNGSGKTSVLDSIYWALGGSSKIQGKPIRSGQRRAKVELDLGDIVVRRTFTEAGTSLVIENKDGSQFKSPQSLLDSLVGRFTFDPLEFMRMDSTHQLAALREMVGLDFTDIDIERQKVYEQRTMLNREIKALEGRVSAITLPPNVPKEPVSTEDLSAKLQAAMSQQARVARALERREEIRKQIDLYERNIERIQRQIEEAKQQIDTLKTEHREAGVVADEKVPDINAIRESLGRAGEHNRAIEQKKQKDELQKELFAKQNAADEATGKLEQLDGEKVRRLKEVEFPLPELSLEERTVTYKGLPLEQASSAEQLRVSMAMAMKYNPKLRVIRITDGSLLDEASMKVVEQMAKEGDYQVWVELVNTSEKVGIVIADGEVKTVNEDATTEVSQ